MGSTSFTTPSEEARGNNGEEKLTKMKQSRKKDQTQHESQFSFDQCLDQYDLFLLIAWPWKIHIYDRLAGVH